MTKIETVVPSLPAEGRDLIGNKLYVMYLATIFSFPLPESEAQTFQQERKEVQQRYLKTGRVRVAIVKRQI